MVEAVIEKVKIYICSQCGAETDWEPSLGPEPVLFALKGERPTSVYYGAEEWRTEDDVKQIFRREERKYIPQRTNFTED